MQLFAAVPIRDILDKPEDNLKRDSAFTDNSLNNLNMTK